MNKAAFEAYFNSPSSGKFKNNTTQDIEPEDERDLVTKIKDNVFFLDDHLYSGARGLLAPVSNIAGLKAIQTVNLVYGIVVFFPDGGSSDQFRPYQLKNSTTAESSPDWIRPDDYDVTSNHKVWKLLPIVSSSTGEVDGGTI